MKGLFSYDNPVMRFITKFGLLWWLDILFIVTSLPVFTIGVSATALNYACRKLLDDEGTATTNYFKSWKENFKQGTGLGLIYLAFAALIILSLYFYKKIMPNNILFGLGIAIAIVYLFSLCWVFAIQSFFVHKVKDTIHYSFLIAFQNLPETVLMIITIGCVVFLDLTQVYAFLIVTLNFGIGWIFYMFAIFYKKVFDRYVNKEDYIQKSKDAQTMLK